MAEFNNSYLLTIENEGGYSATHNEDYGGETYMGIARRWHPAWQGWAAIDAKKAEGHIPHGQGDLVPSVWVRSFYMEEFWKKLKCQELRNQVFANQLFDHAVTSGHEDAVKLAQLACGSSVDGRIGPKTIERINSGGTLEARVLNRRMFKLRTCFYLEASDKGIAQEANLPSWISRTVKCYTG